MSKMTKWGIGVLFLCISFYSSLALINTFPSPLEVSNWVRDLHEKFPTVVSEFMELGKSYNGAPISYFCVGQCDDNRPAVLFTALHHGREPMGLLSIMDMVEDLLNGWKHGESYRSAILASRKIVILPIINVDSYTLNLAVPQLTKRMARKSRRPGCKKGDITLGVDLNRNYDFEWSVDTKGSSRDVCAEDYEGSKPFSEPETQAVRSLFERIPNIILAINWHSYGEFINVPYANQVRGDPPEPIYSHLLTLAKRMSNATGYGYGHPWTGGLYSVNGEASDWMLTAYQTLAFSPEIGPFFDAPFFESMWPEPSRWGDILLRARALADIALSSAGGDLVLSGIPQIPANHHRSSTPSRNPHDTVSVHVRSQLLDAADEKCVRAWELAAGTTGPPPQHLKKSGSCISNTLYLSLSNEGASPVRGPLPLLAGAPARLLARSMLFRARGGAEVLIPKVNDVINGGSHGVTLGGLVAAHVALGRQDPPGSGDEPVCIHREAAPFPGVTFDRRLTTDLSGTGEESLFSRHLSDYTPFSRDLAGVPAVVDEGDRAGSHLNQLSEEELIKEEEQEKEAEPHQNLPPLFFESRVSPLGSTRVFLTSPDSSEAADTPYISAFSPPISATLEITIPDGYAAEPSDEYGFWGYFALGDADKCSVYGVKAPWPGAVPSFIELKQAAKDRNPGISEAGGLFRGQDWTTNATLAAMRMQFLMHTRGSPLKERQLVDDAGNTSYRKNLEGDAHAEPWSDEPWARENPEHFAIVERLITAPRGCMPCAGLFSDPLQIYKDGVELSKAERDLLFEQAQVRAEAELENRRKKAPKEQSVSPPVDSATGGAEGEHPLPPLPPHISPKDNINPDLRTEEEMQEELKQQRQKQKEEEKEEGNGGGKKDGVVAGEGHIDPLNSSEEPLPVLIAPQRHSMLPLALFALLVLALVLLYKHQHRNYNLLAGGASRLSSESDSDSNSGDSESGLLRRVLGVVSTPVRAVAAAVHSVAFRSRLIVVLRAISRALGTRRQADQKPEQASRSSSDSADSERTGLMDSHPSHAVAVVTSPTLSQGASAVAVPRRLARREEADASHIL